MQQSNAAPQNRNAATPSRVAQALEQLGNAGRLMGDVRLSTDRILEVILNMAEDTSDRLNSLVEQDSVMQQHFHNLRAIGKQLQESGVLTVSLRSRIDSQGLNLPVVWNEGDSVDYAWQRQLTSQDIPAVMNKTRLALKAFTEQRRIYFPHLADEDESGVVPASEKQSSDEKSLADILSSVEKEVPGVQTFAYQRFDWLKWQSSTTHEKTSESQDSVKEGASVIELLIPGLFRAIISLHTAGSMDPDAVAFFSSDESGSHIHARGFSLHHVFRHVSEHASPALMYFNGAYPGSSLYYLLHWICSNETLFTRACSKCNKFLAMDRSGVLLPPIRRPFRKFVPGGKSSDENRKANLAKAFHIGCFSE